MVCGKFLMSFLIHIGSLPFYGSSDYVGTNVNISMGKVSQHYFVLMTSFVLDYAYMLTSISPFRKLNLEMMPGLG